VTQDDLRELSRFIAYGNGPPFGAWQVTKDEEGRIWHTYCGRRVEDIELPKPVRDYPFTPPGYHALMDDIERAGGIR